jgi:hypothetical protein
MPFANQLSLCYKTNFSDLGLCHMRLGLCLQNLCPGPCLRILDKNNLRNILRRDLS